MTNQQELKANLIERIKDRERHEGYVKADPLEAAMYERMQKECHSLLRKELTNVFRGGLYVVHNYATPDVSLKDLKRLVDEHSCGDISDEWSEDELKAVSAIARKVWRLALQKRYERKMKRLMIKAA